MESAMQKILMVVALSLALGVQANASPFQNGTSFNGVWQNGVYENGLWQNGIWENGVYQNGVWQNGAWSNGLWTNGIVQNGHSNTYVNADIGPDRRMTGNTEYIQTSREMTIGSATLIRVELPR
jgi:hypothetical protein